MTSHDVRAASRWRYLLELLLLGAALLRPHFALDVLHHFDVGLQVFSDSLGEDEVEHEVVSLRLQCGDCRGWGCRYLAFYRFLYITADFILFSFAQIFNIITYVHAMQLSSSSKTCLFCTF